MHGLAYGKTSVWCRSLLLCSPGEGLRTGEGFGTMPLFMVATAASSAGLRAGAVPAASSAGAEAPLARDLSGGTYGFGAVLLESSWFGVCLRIEGQTSRG